MSPKESHSEESHSEERRRDLDCPSANRKKRDSQTGVVAPPSQPKKYPRLHEALTEYMQEDPDDEPIPPRDRHVVDVMNAACGASECEVIDCLKYLRNERGLKPGTKHGPRHFSWFATVVGDYFRQRREREEAASPVGHASWEDRNETRLSKTEFDSMTEAF